MGVTVCIYIYIYICIVYMRILSCIYVYMCGYVRLYTSIYLSLCACAYNEQLRQDLITSYLDADTQGSHQCTTPSQTP